MTYLRVQRPVGASDVAAVQSLMISDSASRVLSADLQSEDMVASFIRALNTQQWAMPRLVTGDADAAYAMFFTTDVDMRNLSGRLVAIAPYPHDTADDIRHYLRDLFLWYPFHRIYALVPSSLTSLVQEHKAAGFRHEGTLRDHYVHGDLLETAEAYALLRPEFFAAMGQADDS